MGQKKNEDDTHRVGQACTERVGDTCIYTVLLLAWRWGISLFRVYRYRECITFNTLLS